MTGHAHVQDSRLLRHLFSTPVMAEVFSDARTLKSWLDVEAALAQVQAGLSMIPDEAATAICNACSVDHFNLDDLGEQLAKASHPLTPVIAAIEQKSGEHGQYVHFGATTQDIMDTGLVLQMRDGLDEIITSHDRLVAAFIAQSKRWRALPMAGRTHGQHAVPITLGLKFALLATETDRHLSRFKQLRTRLPVQFAGAAGTLATLGDKAADVRAALAELLDLKDPEESWHTARDLVANMVTQLAMSAATCGKVASEIVNLQRSEIGELAEGAAPGAGGSSTMPQKRNPMIAQNVAALARLMTARPGLAIEAMMHEHERDMTCWTMEWAVVPESFIYTHAALEQTTRLIANLQVNEQRIAQNLTSSGGLICSEAVMMDLAADMGRNEAHHAIAEIIATAHETGSSFADALNADARISKLRTPARIANLLDPANYLGQSVQIVDRIVRELE
jgi:adenylosuccinate lyase